MDFNPVLFRDFIQDIYAEWRGKGRDALVDFAEYCHVSQQTMSKWYNGKIKQRPELEQCEFILKNWGKRAYTALAIPVPEKDDYDEISISSLPQDMQVRFRKAMAEIDSTLAERQLDSDSDEGLEVIRESFGKYGLNVTVNK